MNYNTRLPSEALFVNGVALEEQLQGYRTLGVVGRELHPVEVNRIERTVLDGSKVVGFRYPERVITVNYLVRAEGDFEFREIFRQMNQILGGGIKELRFNDDYSNHYRGYLTDVGTIPEGRNTVVSSFTLVCGDPFKYGPIQSSRGREVLLMLDDTYETEPETITVFLEQNSSTVTLRNGDRQVRLSGGIFSEGQEITFDFKERTVYSGKESLDNTMDLASQFEDFYLTSEDPIRMVEAGEIGVTFREVSL